MKKLITLGVAIAISLNAKPTQANPVIAAPALCATGIGCFLVGAVVIGGVTYYIWEHGGREILADKYGKPYGIDDPEEQGEIWDEPIMARTKSDAMQKCKYLARKYKVVYVDTFHDGRSFVCRFSTR
jgi:hypothetical protein